MRLVVVESPLAGDFERNQRYARFCLLDCLRRGEAPFASHLLYTQALDDRVKTDRDLGMQAGFEWAKAPGVVRVVYEDLGVSQGMAHGLLEAKASGQEIERRTLPPELMAMFEAGGNPPSTPR